MGSRRHQKAEVIRAERYRANCLDRIGILRVGHMLSKFYGSETIPLPFRRGDRYMQDPPYRSTPPSERRSRTLGSEDLHATGMANDLAEVSACASRDFE